HRAQICTDLADEFRPKGCGGAEGVPTSVSEGVLRQPMNALGCSIRHLATFFRRVDCNAGAAAGAVTKGEFRLKRGEDRLIVAGGRFKTLRSEGCRAELTLAGD